MEQKNIRILQAGVEKSGNYWLFNIIKELLVLRNLDILNGNSREHGIGDKFIDIKLSYENQQYIDTVETKFNDLYQIISSVYSEKIIDKASFARSTNYIWTHSSFDGEIRELANEMTHIVYLIRDPRDVAISKSKFAFKPYSLKNRWSNPGKSPDDYLKNRADRIMIKWANHVESYSKYDNVHFIYYENLFLDFKYELNRLSKYLGIDITDQQLETIEYGVSADNLRKKDPEHVRKGKIGNWKTYPNQKLITKITRMNASILLELGYPLENNQEFTLLKKANSEMIVKNKKKNIFQLLLIGLKTSKSVGDFFNKSFRYLLFGKF
jgi:aryl sulfotransferase